MGKKDKTTWWSNVAPKPKGFNFVKGEMFTHTYEVPIMGKDEFSFGPVAKQIDKITVKVRLKNEIEPGFSYTIQNIDLDYTKESIIKELGPDVKFEYDDHIFMRDRRYVPFVSAITVYTQYVDNYKRYRLLKARKEKLEKIRIKING
jgi:hypothetical protein